MNTLLSGPTVGASGAVMGCTAAFGYLYANEVWMILFFPFPVKVKWITAGYIVGDLYAAAANSAGDNVAHFAHLGGALIGFLLAYFWKKSNKRYFY